MSEDPVLARYARPVPRYTSYPTAPHFAGLPDGAVYRRWLEALAPSTELSLYLHVPFCSALCLFCGCHTSVVNQPRPLAAYAASLRAEIALIAAALGRRLVIRHLHWGGGTPTLLGAADLALTMRALARHFDFAADAEIAVEIDPRTLSREMAGTLQEIGATRASLGVQDFDPVVMESVHRLQPFEVVAEAVLSLRRAGIAGINFDLMYGLPYQSEESVARTAGRALELAPDRIAVFGYAHVPWVKRHQRLLPEAALPDLNARYRQREAAARVLTEAGYIPVGFDHFARPGDALAAAAASGRLRRNFQGYTTDGAPVLIGFGASAISALPHAYVQNAPRIPEWSAAVRAGRLPAQRGIVLSAEDLLRRAVIEAIMCRLEVDLAATAERYGASFERLLSPALAEFAEDGLIAWDGRRLRVAERGRPFLRAIAALFDAYYRPEAGLARYSQGI
jgi:oxygen-independent coproporphyrinogen III oxidase